MTNKLSAPLEKVRHSLLELCKYGNASPNIPSVCMHIMNRQPHICSPERERLHLCLSLIMIDIAEAHTKSAFDVDSLSERFMQLNQVIEGLSINAAECLNLANELNGVCDLLDSLTIAKRKLIVKVSPHHYQIARLAHQESKVADAITAASSQDATLSLDNCEFAPHLTEEQTEAVKASIQSRISVIVGGPGTGKTSIIAELLCAVHELGIDPKRMILAAPTGKAAYRMGESISMALKRYDVPQKSGLAAQLTAPMTLHRLLDYQPWSGQFGRHEQSPIPADLIIIDEASMVDLELFLHLIEALYPDTRLVLLGDPGQIPSVGSGAVLRDLIEANAVQISRLTKSFRMNEADPAGSQIYQASRQILERPEAIQKLNNYTMQWSSWSDNPPQGIHCSQLKPSEYPAFIQIWYERFYSDNLWSTLGDTWAWPPHKPPRALKGAEVIFKRFNKARILAPTRVGLQGTIRLNEGFTQSVRLAIDGPTLNGFGIGDLVICTRNDYRLELFNGDQGVVIGNGSQIGEERLWVLFEGGSELRLYPLSLVSHLLEHAFALTVHKSQGSEFEVIALSLPAQTAVTVSQPLVYTAITRAKREVLVLGSAQALMRAAQTKLDRSTALGHWLSRTPSEVESA